MFVFFSLFILLLGIYYWRKRRYFWLLNKIPTYPNGLPVIGHAHLSMDIKGLIKYVKSIGACANSLRGVIKFWLGPFPIIVITSPEDSETVLNSCLNKGFVYKFSKSWVGQGLITSKASVWKRHIKKLSPAFNQRVLDGFLAIFNEQSSVLVDTISENLGRNPFDVYPYIGAANLETICQTAMGTKMDLQATPDHPYLDAIEKALHVITKRSTTIWLHPQCIFNLTKYKKEHDAAINILHNVSKAVISKKKAEFKEEKERNEDNNIMAKGSKSNPSFRAFLDLILELSGTEYAFSDEETRQHVDTMIAAGQETTSHTVLYTLLLLGSHGNVQEKVYQELQRVFESRDDCSYVHKEDLTKLPYLEAVIKESMRLYPVVPMVFRYIDKELNLKDYTIPKGCNCGISIWGLNRHERWGKDYDCFRPERWLEPDGVPDHPASFGTFSYGRRICIGRHYAMMSMKVMLAHILRRYRITSDVSKLKLNVFFVLKPVSGHHITIELR